MNEAQLNALKGLLHYLNGPQAPEKPARGLSVAPEPAPSHGGLTFVADVFEPGTGNLLGMVRHDDGEYCFYPGLKSR